MNLLKFYHMKKFWLVLFIIWTLMIIAVSVVPYSSEMVEKVESDFRWDYLQHFVAYFAFAGLYILWRSDQSLRIRNTELLVMLLVIISFSVLTEYVQLLVPGRSFNPVDIMYNLAGAISSFLIVYLLIIRSLIRKKFTEIKS